MRVLVVGSSRPPETKKDDIDRTGLELGRTLAKHGHTILVGTDDPVDIDPSVVAGALEDSKKRPSIEVHVPHSMSPPFPNEDENAEINLQIRWHQFPDWDVTNMEVIKNVDAVIAVGGRAGVVQAGISAWMFGVPIIPVASFGGGARTLWEYGSSRRSEFYHQGIGDVDIDRLAGPWREESAEFVVDALERVATAANLDRSPRWLLLLELAVMFVALVGWVFLLTFPSMFGSVVSGWADKYNFLLLFATVSASGLLGASMQTLRKVRSGIVVTWRGIVIDTALGITAGIISAMLYLLAQAGINGGVTVEMTEGDYIRVALIVSMASLFAALYLESALARFDEVKDSVMQAKYHETGTG